MQDVTIQDGENLTGSKYTADITGTRPLTEKTLVKISRVCYSHHPRDRILVRGVRRRRLWNQVRDRSRDFRLTRARRRNGGVRIREDIVLRAVFEVVEVQAEGWRIGAFEHLR